MGGALVGVFISVTTVPAAADMAISLALGGGREFVSAATQLGINLAGVQRLLEIGEQVRRMKPLLDERTLATEGGRRRLLLEMRRLGDAVGM